MENELILDEFGIYFEKYGLHNLDTELFFSMLSCPSTIIQKFAVKRFLEPGKNFGVVIENLYPLGDEDFEIIKDDNYMRNLEFKINYLDSKLEEGDETVKVRYLTSSFPVDLNLKSDFSNQFLEVLSSADEEILTSDLKFILREIWSKNILFLWFYSIINWLATILFFIATVFYQNNFWVMLFSCIFFFMLLAFELVVAYQDVKRYFKSMYNFADIFLYIFMPLIMWFNFLNIFDDETKWYYAVISITMVIAAGRALTMLRVLDGVRYLVAMILHVFTDMKAFMFILVGSIFFFALIELEVMKTVAPAEGEEKPEFYTLTHYFIAWDAMYNLAYGGWEGSNEYNKNQYFHFLVNTIFLALIMLNILIAIISETFTEFDDKKEVSDIKEMINMLQDFNYFIRELNGTSKIKRNEGQMMFMKRKAVAGEEKFIHLIKKFEEEEINIEEKMDDLENNLEEMKEEFTKELKSSESKIKKILEDRGDDIRKNAEQNKTSLEILIEGGENYEKTNKMDLEEKTPGLEDFIDEVTKNLNRLIKNLDYVISNAKIDSEEEESGEEENEEGSGEEENEESSEEK